MRNILHIAAHLGGGVGKAVLGAAAYSNKVFQSAVAVLEEPEKPDRIEEAQKGGLEIYVKPSEENLKELITAADIVIVNWWNHPVMSEFLYSFPEISCRLVLWMHVNGCFYPYVPFEFLDRFDYLFFTSSYSYENPMWSESEQRRLKDKSGVILGNGLFYPEKMECRKDYTETGCLKVGYAGTLNYSKMHKDYIKYCEAALEYSDKIEFLLAGDPEKELLKDMEKSRMKDKSKVLGYVNDMDAFYLSLDVLGYILNGENYGTTENVILEAMAFGIPVIAYDSGVERNIIDHGKNGFLVKSPREYADCILQLSRSRSLREEIGRNGREKVCRCFSGRENLEKFYRTCNELLKTEKRLHSFYEQLGNTPAEWFLYFTGGDRAEFEAYLNQEENENHSLKNCRPIYKGKTKSSVHHFYLNYPYDPVLKRLAEGISRQ